MDYFKPLYLKMSNKLLFLILYFHDLKDFVIMKINFKSKKSYYKLLLIKFISHFLLQYFLHIELQELKY